MIVVSAGDVASYVSANELGNVVLMRITHHPAHAGQGSYFFRGSLRVAAGHQDLASRVVAIDPPNGGARVLISSGGNGARVQHHNLRCARRSGLLQTLDAQLLL
jgi:hypothetical protein